MRLRNRACLLAVAAVSLGGVATLVAQTAAKAVDPPAQSDSTAIIRTDVRLVVLHTTVVDKTGHFVTNLPQQAFSVYENGVAQKVQKFKLLWVK